MKPTYAIILIVGVLMAVAIMPGKARYTPLAAMQAYNGRDYYPKQNAYATPMEGK